ncbi:NADPH:quinone oxidoreductase family protein [Rhodococcus koreensis]
MRAFELKEYSGPDGLTLTDVAAPQPSADEVVLQVAAIGVNYPDLLMTRGQYQNKPDLPAIPGCEVAGTVISAPTGSGWTTGDRAAAFVWEGGYAEQVTIPLNSIAPIPESVSFEFAAGMVVNYHTVHFALARRGRVAAGETVLVMGAGGGIGTAALQVAKGLGARVIAGVANENQIATATAAGAAETIVLEQGFAARLRELTEGVGVDVVLDPLGDWLFDEAIRGLAPEGRLLVIGFAAGNIPAVKVNRLLLRNISVVGVAFGAFLELDSSLMREQATSLNKMIAAGTVNPQISLHYPFDELPTALHRLGRGEIDGKAVVSGPSSS